jgi:hypothetical protein
MLVAALTAGAAWGATPAETAKPKATAKRTTAPKPRMSSPRAAAPAKALTEYEAGLKDLDRNVALGQALTKREGSADELAMVQKLAERGEASARQLVERDPKSAPSQYLLGSWLLYGYHVAQIEQVETDASGEERHLKVKAVVQGLGDSPMEGLEALRTAQELDPKNASYLMDYSEALLDWGQPTEAMSVLKQVWAADLTLTATQKVRVALLMSDIHAERGELPDARKWLYRALSELPQNAPIVQRLQELDSRQSEAEKVTTSPVAPPDEIGGEEQVVPGPEEVTPNDTGQPQDEVTPAPGDNTGEQAAPAPSDDTGYQAAPAPSSGDSGGEVSPPDSAPPDTTSPAEPPTSAPPDTTPPAEPPTSAPPSDSGAEVGD